MLFLNDPISKYGSFHSPFPLDPWQAGSLVPPAEFVAVSVSHQPCDFLGFYQLYFQEGINRSKKIAENNVLVDIQMLSVMGKGIIKKIDHGAMFSSSCGHRLFLKPCLFLGLDILMLR